MLQKKFLNGVEILSVDKTSVVKALKEIADRIRQEQSRIKEIILFGSFSQDEFTPHSDIDIAIILDKSDKKFIERSDEFIDYFSEMPFDVNLLVYTSGEVNKMVKEKNCFINNILKGTRL